MQTPSGEDGAKLPYVDHVPLNMGAMGKIVTWMRSVSATSLSINAPMDWFWKPFFFTSMKIYEPKLYFKKQVASLQAGLSLTDLLTWSKISIF